MTIISHYWPYYESYWPYYESWLFLHSPPSFVAMKNKTRPLFIAQNHLHLGAQAAFNQGKYVDKKWLIQPLNNGNLGIKHGFNMDLTIKNVWK